VMIKNHHHAADSGQQIIGFSTVADEKKTA
jgi:hypothetical protein